MQVRFHCTGGTVTSFSACSANQSDAGHQAPFQGPAPNHRAENSRWPSDGAGTEVFSIRLLAFYVMSLGPFRGLVQRQLGLGSLEEAGGAYHEPRCVSVKQHLRCPKQQQVEIIDEYEPLEEGLDKVTWPSFTVAWQPGPFRTFGQIFSDAEVTDVRNVSVIEIKLSKADSGATGHPRLARPFLGQEPLDTTDKGYQPPLDESLVKEFEPEDWDIRYTNTRQ